MVLKVFIDESGKGEPPVFVMAGFIARAEQWAAFNDEWNAKLREAPSVDAFHMTDARWQGYDTKLPALLDIIRANVLGGIAISIPFEDYQREIKGKIGFRLDQPYFLAFYSIIYWSLVLQKEAGSKEEMDFIFDEQRSDSDFLHSVWPTAVGFLPENLKALVGGRPIHMDDKYMPPLQAADILAWYLRRRFARGMQGQRREVELDNLFRGLTVHHQHIDAKPLRGLWKKIRESNRQAGMVTEHELNKFLPHRDKFIQMVNKQAIEAAQPGDTIALQTFPATQMKRFLLVHSCARCGRPHLHRREGGVCLAEERGVPEAQPE